MQYNNSTKLLATAGMDKQILIWNPKDSYENILTLKSHTNAVTTLSWSYMDHLITGSADKSICNWDV